jgi:capsular polysaccharide biosynthesis protein
MELRLYWKIIKRRLWLIVALLVIVGASFLVYAPQSPTSFVANMRFVVGIQPEPGSGYTYDRYYTWLTAEYLLDDMAEVVKSQAFANDVAALAGLDVPVGAIQGATSAGKLHRILNVSVTWHNQEELARIANAIVQNLVERGNVYFAQLATDQALVSVIDPPTIFQPGPSLRQRLDLPLRLMLALVVGVFGAFVWNYLDDTLREPSELEQLGVTVLAEIPNGDRWPARLWRRRSQP